MSEIKIERKNCVDCGACTAVCKSQALSMETVFWSLVFDKNKCIGCGLCLRACPLRVIKVCNSLSRTEIISKSS